MSKATREYKKLLKERNYTLRNSNAMTDGVVPSGPLIIKELKKELFKKCERKNRSKKKYFTGKRYMEIIHRKNEFKIKNTGRSYKNGFKPQ